LIKYTRSLLIHRTSHIRRHPTQEPHAELSLLVRELLLIDKVLILLVKQLLLQSLKLSARTKPSLTDAHTLLIALHAKTTKRPRRSQLLGKALKTEISTELPGLLAQLCSRKTILSTLSRVLEAKLVLLGELCQPLLLRLKLRRLVQLTCLHAEIGTQLLLTEQSLKVELPRLHPSLLISQSRLHLSRTIRTKLLRRLLKRLLTPRRLDALQLLLKISISLSLKQRLAGTPTRTGTDTLRLKSRHLTSIVLNCAALLLLNHAAHIGRHVILHRLRTKPLSPDLLRACHLILLQRRSANSLKIDLPLTETWVLVELLVPHRRVLPKFTRSSSRQTSQTRCFTQFGGDTHPRDAFHCLLLKRAEPCGALFAVRLITLPDQTGLPHTAKHIA
jgi:hypothetical protein